MSGHGRCRTANVLLACVALSLSNGLSARAVSLQEHVTVVTESPLRTWTSSDGRFRQEGKLVQVAGEGIRLETADGKQIAVSLAKLSADDQAFVQQELRRSAGDDNPFAEVDPMSPFAPAGDPPPGSLAPVDPEALMRDAPFVHLESDQPVDLESGRWALPEAPQVKPVRFAVESVHTRAVRGFTGAKGDLLIVSLTDPFGTDYFGPQRTETPDGREAEAGKCKSWVQVISLPEGKTVGQFPLPTERTVAGDVHGLYLLAFDGPHSTEPRLRVYEMRPNGLTPRAVWTTRSSDGRNEAVESARFLADGKVVSHSRGELVVWDLNPVRPLHVVSNSDADWRLANDRRHALVEHDGRKFEVDLIAGECTGVLGDGESGHDPKAGGVPSPDGARVAIFRDFAITLRDAAGNELDEFFVPVFWPTPTLSWIDDRTLCLESPHQTHFIDLERRVALLEIANVGNRNRADSETGSLWEFETGQDRGRPFVVVRPRSLRTASTGPDLDRCRKSIPPDAASLLLQEGDRVRLTVQLSADPSLADQARTDIRRLLEARGVTVSDSAQDELRVRSEIRNETVEYRQMGVAPWREGASETVNVRSVVNTIELIRDGQVVWSRTSGSGPGFMLHIREGETAQQAADRQAGKPEEFWKILHLPRHIASHPNASAWFRVMKTGQGYQPLN